MKKLHSLAFYALVTPVITLGAGSLLAQPSADQNADREQRAQGAAQSAQSAGQSDSQAQSHMPHRGYMGAAPAGGMQASNLIGANVKTGADEDVGSVSDLIIDGNGQVVAIVVGVGGFLGMGERDVAIGWDDVTRSGTPDEQELRIDLTRESLMAAPEFDRKD